MWSKTKCTSGEGVPVDFAKAEFELELRSKIKCTSGEGAPVDFATAELEFAFITTHIWDEVLRYLPGLEQSVAIVDGEPVRVFRPPFSFLRDRPSPE